VNLGKLPILLLLLSIVVAIFSHQISTFAKRNATFKHIIFIIIILLVIFLAYTAYSILAKK